MKPMPWPLWIAHRGAGKLAPENTLAAFRLGAQFGYAAFECDVKLSADAARRDAGPHDQCTRRREPAPVV
jgi:glycerophosphoryl diester phosphodiesterase